MTAGEPFRSAGAAAEVAVAFAPFPRILSFQPKGKTSLFAGEASSPFAGIRFVAYEKDGRGQKEFPFDSPATQISKTGRGFAWECFSGDGPQAVKLVVDATVADDEPVLAVRCRLINLGENPRRLALWAINSLLPEGWLVTTLSRGLEDGIWTHGKVTGFWTSGLGEPCLQLGREGMMLDVAKWPREEALKYGTRSSGAWLAAVRSDGGSALLVRLPYETTDTYPDEDSNGTFWLGGKGPDLRAEMEWLSRWEDVPAGGTLEWSFRMEDIDLPKGGVMSPDGLVAKIRDTRKIAGRPGPASGWRLAADSPQERDRFGRVTAWFSGSESSEEIARAPLWQGAPVWEDGGLVWKNGTVVEAAALPPWRAAGRKWTFHASRPSGTGEGPILLMQEGDADSGMALVVEGDKVVALIWLGPENLVRAALDIGSRPVLAVNLLYRPDKAELLLEMDGETARAVLPAGWVVSPPARLVIGRGAAFPASTGWGQVRSYTGKIFEVMVASPM